MHIATASGPILERCCCCQCCMHTIAGVTRRSVLDLAQTWRHVSADAGSDSNGPQATLTVSERAITMGEVATAAKAGRLQEVLVL
jgi:hypothetical protein